MLKQHPQLHTPVMGFEGVRIDFYFDETGQWKNTEYICYHRRNLPFTLAAAPRLPLHLVRLYRKTRFFLFYGWIRHNHKDGGHTNSLFYSLNNAAVK